MMSLKPQNEELHLHHHKRKDYSELHSNPILLFFQYQFALHDHESRYQTFQQDIFSQLHPPQHALQFHVHLNDHHHGNHGNHIYVYKYSQRGPGGKFAQYFRSLLIFDQYYESINQWMFPWFCLQRHLK